MTIGQIISVVLTRFPWIGAILRKLGSAYLDGAKVSGGGLSITRITEQHLRGLQAFRFPPPETPPRKKTEADEGRYDPF
ncbi:MAG: hypothetical protein AAB478_04505 [Patescibacteria group bacterium]